MKTSFGKIRIAFVLWTFECMGGSEHVVYDIVRKLDKKKFHILIIGFKDGPFRQLYEQIGVKTEAIESRRKYDINFILRLRKLLKSERISVVNPHHFSPLLYTFLSTRMTDIKIVYTEHSVWQYLELGWIKKMLCNFILFRVEALVAISNQLVHFYQKNFFVSSRKVHLIINGIDLDKFKKLDNITSKKALGFESKDYLVGIIANLRPEKNHKILIKAFSRVAVNNERMHLVLVGLDLMNGELQEYAIQFGLPMQIHFLGSREDIPDILNALDIFCLPSKHEGLPLTVLEAMACGVPVIGSDVMGINEVVKDNENGLLFKDDDKMLSEKIKMLMADKEKTQSFISAGQEFVKENYCLDQKMNQYISLFEMLTKPKGDSIDA